ncbi:hypothetical protein BD560DRAFT_431579 [Blakeslea trispora]|nr:hypothetical protein BD560DRAFT_431579 [Blakeslea trispora]
MSSCSLKPDYLVSLLLLEDEQLDTYSVEAKSPEANKGDMDFVKVGNSMKMMLDELASYSCPLVSNVSFGDLLHGSTMIDYETRTSRPSSSNDQLHYVYLRKRQFNEVEN